MEKLSKEFIQEFDTCYISNHGQILKILFPLLPTRHQNTIACYIKLQEYFAVLKKPVFTRSSASFDSKNWMDLDFHALKQELSPYCNTKEMELLKKLENLIQMYQTYQNMQQYMPLFQELQNGSGDISEMLQSILTPEQMSMFENFMNT